MSQDISNSSTSGEQDRVYSIHCLRRVVDPVILALAEGKLKKVLPRRNWETRESDLHTSHLQAFGRSLSGMAPWLSLGADDSEEGKLRGRYTELSQAALARGVDPESSDYLFGQPTLERIVHAAYVAYPLLIAPKQLFEPLSDRQKSQVIEALKTARAFKPVENNWVLFSAVIECAIWQFTGECETKAIDYAVQRHMQWYLGDGTYGDGPEFHWDYYNSYVIHPLLLETLRACRAMKLSHGDLLDRAVLRGQRFAEVMEHLISPEGTFPVLGRSSVYRFAAFKQVGYMAYRWSLPATLQPGATRAALTAVIRRMIEAPGTFDANGFLECGVVGNQPEARDVYNYTGALYMCAMGLTHLGVPGDAPLWSEPAGAWFQQRVWSGGAIANQAAYYEKK